MSTAKQEILELKEYDYHLPPELIASYPNLQRSDSRLLVYQPGKTPAIQDKKFRDLPDLLKAEDLLILNNTRVSARRLKLKRKSGAHIEALFLKELPNQSWLCLLRGKSKLKSGERLYLSEGDCTASSTGASSYTDKLALVRERRGGSKPKKENIHKKKPEKPEFIFSDSPSPRQANLLPVLAGTEKAAWANSTEAEACFASYGEVPIPPYLGRKVEEMDKERYQTVYARKPGSAAAPTAGLHFCTDLLARLKACGLYIESLELEVGYGTFAPLAAENFESSRLHTEEYSLSDSLARLLNQKNKGRRIAVGTSTLRALEANFRRHKGCFAAGQFKTDLFLKPPEPLCTTQGLITNFHLPASSLLLLAAAYVGKKEILSVYRHAIQARYRFFSYGDAMLILL